VINEHDDVIGLTGSLGLELDRLAELEPTTSSSALTVRPRSAGGSRTIRWISGQGQVRLESDVSMLEWFLVTAERVPGKSSPWYVNGKPYKQVLAPVVSRKSRTRRHDGPELALQTSRCTPHAGSLNCDEAGHAAPNAHGTGL
jgi:hypothetical protein